VESVRSPDGPVVRISDCLSDGPSSNLGQDAFYLLINTSSHIQPSCLFSFKEFFLLRFMVYIQI
jgi:hypothetical protein